MVKMNRSTSNYKKTILFIILSFSFGFAQTQKDKLVIGKAGYFEMPGLNVLVYNNTFPEGHQGGVEIIQHGNRVATNGELRLNATPGQWQPIPKLGTGHESIGVSPMDGSAQGRIIDSLKNEISISCSYPDSSRMRKGFNPIIYPDLQLKYNCTGESRG